MRLKNIDDVNECPHCGSNFGYYQRYFVSGWIQDNKLFEDRQPYNMHMWDSIRERSKAKPTCYCMECDNPIGTKK